MTGARRISIAGAMLAICACQLLAASPVSASETVYEGRTVSWYVTTYDGNFAYARGCALGKEALAGKAANKLQLTQVVLDFGTEYFNSSGALGVSWTDLDGKWHPISAVYNYVSQFSSGYYICTGTDTSATLLLTAGVRNLLQVGSGVPSFNSQGKTWAQTVKGWGDSQTQPNWMWMQTLWEGGIDAESPWSTAAQARAWADGFNAGSTGIAGREPSVAYFDFGSANGCPPYGSCNNSWTQGDYYYLAWGNPAAGALPEIYYYDSTKGGNAKQWQQISLWGVTHSQSTGAIVFSGDMTQNLACHSTSSRLAGCTSQGTGQGQPAGWNQLAKAVASDSRTATLTRNRATDIDWDTDPNAPLQ